MASSDAQMDWRGRTSSEEGISTHVKYKGLVGDILKSLRKGIKSGLSYSGARTIQQFQTKAKFACQTSAGLNESTTHILFGRKKRYQRAENILCFRLLKTWMLI